MLIFYLFEPIQTTVVVDSVVFMEMCFCAISRLV